jgi:LuxR family quorum-sensing system transcriptional regulator CciR
MSELTDVQTFIDSSRRVRSARELEQLLAHISQHMGFDYYALIHHVDLTPMNAERSHMDDGDLIALTNYPQEWVATYVARSIVSNDPVHLASHRTNVGFRWDEVGKLIDLTSAHRSIRVDTLKAGLDQGFTVPANIPGEANGSCSFAMRRGRVLPAERLAMAQLVGSFAFQAARSLVLRARDTHELRRRTALPPRQLDCILLVAKGRSDAEIADELGISEETVKWYLKEARQTYGVNKRVQLVLRTIFDGQLAISDIFSERPPRTGG